MKRVKKKLLLMSLLVCGLLAEGNVCQAAEKTLIDTIPYGDKINAYIYDTDGDMKADQMIVSGSGKMKNLTCHCNTTPYRAEEVKKYAADIRSIEIENGITSIGNFAFAGFTSAESIKMPTDKELLSIGEYAFIECSACESIVLPDSVSAIGDFAFAMCYRLKTVNIPGKLRRINKGLFYDCNAIGILDIPANIEYVNRDAFSVNTLLICDQNSCLWKNYQYKSQCIGREIFTYIAGDNLKYIFNPSDLSLIIRGRGAQFDNPPLFTRVAKTVTFENYTGDTIPDMSVFRGMTSVIVPEGITTIKKSGFSWCEELVSVTLPNSLKTIESDAFSNCCKLKELKIPNGVTSIDSRAFLFCDSLETINIPDGVSRICSHLFEGCKSLKTISLPESIVWIQDDAFMDCTSLQTVYIHAKDLSMISPKAFENDKCTIYCYPNVKKTIDDLKLTGITTKSMCEVGYHTLTKTAAKQVTKTAVGNKEYYHCSVCDKYFSDSKGNNEIEKDSWIVKIKQTISYKKIKKYYAKNLMIKKTTFKLGAKASGKGKLTYKVTKGSKKYISVSKKGKVTLKKGCKKGIYKIQITAAETDTYAAAKKTIKIKIK